jgi:hypothetical protein
MLTAVVVSGGDLETFGMKSEMTRGGLLFIGSKIYDSFGILTEVVLL